MSRQSIPGSNIAPNLYPYGYGGQFSYGEHHIPYAYGWYPHHHPNFSWFNQEQQEEIAANPIDSDASTYNMSSFDMHNYPTWNHGYAHPGPVTEDTKPQFPPSAPISPTESMAAKIESRGRSSRTRTKEKYRVVYTDTQRSLLEEEFKNNKYISILKKSDLSKRLQLSQRQVKIWFQNRRAKDRRQEKKPKESSRIEQDCRVSDMNVDNAHYQMPCSYSSMSHNYSPPTRTVIPDVPHPYTLPVSKPSMTNHYMRPISRSEISDVAHPYARPAMKPESSEMNHPFSLSVSRQGGFETNHPCVRSVNPSEISDMSGQMSTIA